MYIIACTQNGYKALMVGNLGEYAIMVAVGYNRKGGDESPHSKLVAEEVGLEDEAEDLVREEAEVDGAEGGDCQDNVDC